VTHEAYGSINKSTLRTIMIGNEAKMVRRGEK